MSDLSPGDVVLYLPADENTWSTDPRFVGVVLGRVEDSISYEGWYWVWFGLSGEARERLDIIHPVALEVVTAVGDLGELWTSDEVKRRFAKRVKRNREEKRI